MNPPPRNTLNLSLRTYARPGLTLIEVLAALAILGGVLVAMLSTKTHALRQQSKSRQALAAAVVLDELVSTWVDHETGRLIVPEETGGEIGDRWRWSLSPLGPVEPYQEILSLVRVELYDDTPRRPRADHASLSLDLVVAVEAAQSAADLPNEPVELSEENL